MNQTIKDRIAKINSGQVPEGYEKTSFGIFPCDWEKGCIQDILKIKHGRSQHEVEDPNGKYPILATGGVIGYTNSYLWNKPCVLIGRKGTIDKPQYMEEPFWTVDTLFYSEVFKGNNARYIYYLFNMINWKKYDESTGVPSLSAKGIEKIKISYPKSEQEQSRIAQILMQWDKTIELQEKYIASLENRKKALMQRLLTPKEGWKKVELGEFIEIKSGYAFKSETYKKIGNYKVITIKNVQQGNLELNDINYIDELPKNLQKHHFLQKGDLIISLTGNVGRSCYVTEDNCLLNQRVGKIEISGINSYFIYSILQTRKFLFMMQTIAQGCAQANLSNEDIENYVVSIPYTNYGIDNEYIKNITQKFFLSDQEISLQKQKLQKLIAQRKALMQVLLTGIVRV